MPDYMEIRTDYFLLTDSSSAIIRTEASSVPIDFNKFRLRYYDSTKCYIDKNIQKLVINDAGSVLILFDKLDKKEWIKVDSSIYDFTKSIDNSFKIKRKYKI